MADDVPKMGTHEEEQEYRAYRRSLASSGPSYTPAMPYIPKPLCSLEEVLPKVSRVYADLMDVPQEDTVQH